mgnify:CR=1 FL=1
MTKLKLADCRKFMAAVQEKAEEMKVPVSVALVTAEGSLICLERMDNAGFITAEIAYAKAYTVAAFRSMSPRFPDGLVIQQWFKERNPQMMMNASVFTNGKIVASGGCMPVFDENEMIGAFGVSGGTSGQDQLMADYARAKVGWAVFPKDDDTPVDVKEHINEIYRSVGLGKREL